MADRHQHTPEPEEELAVQEEQPKREHRFLKRLVVLFLTLLVVLGAVTVALLGEGKYLNRIRRYLVYGSSGAENLYSFAADPNNRFGRIGERLVVLSQNYIQLLGSDGTAYFSQDVQLSRPILDVGDKLAVAYDAGGQNLYVVSEDGEQLHLTLEEGYGFISAELNGSDYLAVVYEESGYKGVVTVYNDKMEKLFAYRSSSQFLSGAFVSEDNSAVTVVAMGQQEGAYCSQLLRYRLTETEPASTATLSGHMTLLAGNMGGGTVSLSESEAVFVDASGQETGEFTYGGLYLRYYALEGDDFVTLLLNRYRSGSISTLVTVGSDGKAIAMLDISDEVMDIAAGGDFVAVLYSDSLVLYDRQLQEQSRLEDTGYASRVLLDASGAALVIGGNTAWRYLP